MMVALVERIAVEVTKSGIGFRCTKCGMAWHPHLPWTTAYVAILRVFGAKHEGPICRA